MRGHVGVLGSISAVVVAAGVVGVAAAGPPSTTTTVRGPATYFQVFGPATLEGWLPAVLVRWRVRVGAGGRAGEVRPQFTNEHDHPATGRWVRLPARPGTYAFASPHVSWDQRDGTIRLDQRVGGHAILERLPGRGFPDVLRRGLTPVHGRRLTITTETEPDLDSDRVGDLTEDRTDLAVTAARGADGALDITVLNRGRRSADLPLLHVTGPAVTGWQPACHAPRDWGPGRRPGPGDCVLPSVLPGETFTVRAELDAGDSALAATVTVQSEGPDLVPADNSATVAGG